MGSQPKIIVLLFLLKASGIYSKVVAEPFDSSSDEAVEKSMEKVPYEDISIEVSKSIKSIKNVRHALKSSFSFKLSRVPLIR